MIIDAKLQKKSFHFYPLVFKMGDKQSSELQPTCTGLYILKLQGTMYM